MKDRSLTDILKENKGKLLLGAAAVAGLLLGWLSLEDLRSIAECVQGGG